jgi:hypothetical protein
MCLPAVGLCRSFAIPFVWVAVILFGTITYRNAETEETRKEAGLALWFGALGVPVLTILSLADLVPGPFGNLFLWLFESLGYFSLLLMGPMMLSGLLIGLGILTAALTKELIGEYA